MEIGQGSGTLGLATRAEEMGAAADVRMVTADHGHHARDIGRYSSRVR